MPCVYQVLARWKANRQTSDADVDLPEDQPLFPPSQVDDDDLCRCAPGIAETEDRLREGQLRDSLDKIRLHLHIKSRLLTFKSQNVRHQVHNTRARQKIDANDVKIRSQVAKYRCARLAKLALAGNGDWERDFRELRNQDIRMLNSNLLDNGHLGFTTESDPPETRPLTEGRRQLLWIWMSADQNDAQRESIGGMNDGKHFTFYALKLSTSNIVWHSTAS